MSENNLFQSFTDKVLDFPLWVKEALYCQLKSSLEQHFDTDLLLKDYKNTFQFYAPKATYMGKKEIESRGRSLSPNAYRFLKQVTEGFNIIEITLSNFWTLEEISKIFCLCLEKELIVRPDEKFIEVLAAYLSGEIRLAEYFKRMEIINVDQLERAMRAQKASEEKGQKIGMGQVMIDLGYISPNDIKLLLLIKDESKKRFIFNFSTSAKKPGMVSAGSPEEMIEKLAGENNELKKQLAEFQHVQE